jgi:hypothetical protein
MSDSGQFFPLEKNSSYSTRLFVNPTGEASGDNQIKQFVSTSTDGTAGDNQINNYEIRYVRIDKEEYYEGLKERQRQHLDNVRKNDSINGVWFKDDFNWKPCMHDSCPYCVGTGIKGDGSMCVHYIACNCPKCATYCC